MATDIIFPDNNEKEFIEMAERLGYKQLVFLYENEIPKLNATAKIDIIQKKAKSFAVEADDMARAYLESGNVRIVYNFELGQKRDFMHHRASGLNHILCTIARDKKKTIGFAFSTILNSHGTAQAQLIGRVMQNIRLCRKFRVRMFIGSFAKSPYEMRAPRDLGAFFQAIGMTGKEVKEGVQLQLP